MLDIHWTITVQVPQLDTLRESIEAIGEKLVASTSGIHSALDLLVGNQASAQEDLAKHLDTIADEIEQLGESPDQAELDAIAGKIHSAAAVTAEGASKLRQATEDVKGMVPDSPPAS